MLFRSELRDVVRVHYQREHRSAGLERSALHIELAVDEIVQDFLESEPSWRAARSVREAE